MGLQLRRTEYIHGAVAHSKESSIFVCSPKSTLKPKFQKRIRTEYVSKIALQNRY